MPITVYAAEVDGSDYNTVPMNVKGSGAGGNGGAAAKINSTSKLDGVTTARTNFTVFASTVVDTDDVEKAIAAGDLAHDHVKPIAKRVTTEIAGQSDDFLVSGASVPSLVQSIHYIKVCDPSCTDGIRSRRFTTAIRGNHYNRFNNTWDGGYPVVAADDYAGIDATSGDVAAKPTRAVPGQLVYKTGAPVPVSDDYVEKTG